MMIGNLFVLFADAMSSHRLTFFLLVIHGVVFLSSLWGVFFADER